MKNITKNDIYHKNFKIEDIFQLIHNFSVIHLLFIFFKNVKFPFKILKNLGIVDLIFLIIL